MMRRKHVRPLQGAIALLFAAHLVVFVTGHPGAGPRTVGDGNVVAEERSLVVPITTTTLPPVVTTTPAEQAAAPASPVPTAPRPSSATTAPSGPPATEPVERIDGTTPAAGCGPTIRKADGTPWRCTFVEDFDGTQLDPSKWGYQLSFNTGYTNSGDCFTGDPRTHVLGGGAMQLKSIAVPTFTCERKNPRKNFTAYFQSGMITTIGRWSQAFGRWEIRAKLPSQRMQGVQTSFWLWPDDPFKYGVWPLSGEIDLMEWYSRYPEYVIPYFHYQPGDTQAAQTQSTWGCQPFRDASEWHTYGLEWTRTHLIATVDGTPCLTHRINALALEAPKPFDQPFSIQLTQTIGRSNNAHTPGLTELPAVTTIDYVRVWE